MWVDEFDQSTTGSGTGRGAGGGFDPNATFSGGESKKQRRAQTLIPMFLKHIQNLSEDLTYFGQQLGMVECVAIVRSQEITSTKVNYEFEDFSDTIKGLLWLDHDGGQVTNQPNLMVNAYYRIIATVRHNSEGRCLVVVKFDDITDFSMLRIHYFNVIKARYEIEHLTKKIDANETYQEKVKENFSVNVGDEFQNRVLKEITALSYDVNGPHVDQILQALKCPRPQLMSALDYLINEGHVYSTVDESHFKATDA